MNSYFSEQRKASKQLLGEDVLESNLKGYGKSSKDSFSGEARFELFTDEKELATEPSREREY